MSPCLTDSLLFCSLSVAAETCVSEPLASNGRRRQWSLTAASLSAVIARSLFCWRGLQWCRWEHVFGVDLRCVLNRLFGADVPVPSSPHDINWLLSIIMHNAQRLIDVLWVRVLKHEVRSCILTMWLELKKAEKGSTKDVRRYIIIEQTLSPSRGYLLSMRDFGFKRNIFRLKIFFKLLQFRTECSFYSGI
jgi:hypothetical protein